MQKFIIASLLCAGLLSAPAIAQENEEEEKPIETGWFTTQGGVSVHHSGIILPLILNNQQVVTSPVPQSGSNGMDNIIQYRDKNSDIFASIYIYKPSFADAELTAAMTDRAIRQSFGINAEPNLFTTASIAGKENSALILAYEDSPKNLATAGAFAKVNDWILKIRVSGPKNEYDGVINLLNTALEDIKFDAAPEQLSSVQPKNCVNKLEGKAKFSKKSSSDNPLLSGLLSGLAGGLFSEKDEDGEESEDGGERIKRPSFSNWCIADSFVLDTISYNIYRTTDEKDSTIIMPTSDTGSVILTGNALLSKDRSLSIYNIGSIDNYGEMKGDLSAKQYQQMLTGKNKFRLIKNSSNIIKANGDTTITLFTG